MSYGFTVKGANKTQVKAKVVAEFDKVVANQPIHVNDRDQALAAACAFVDLLPEDNSRDISVAVNGAVGWEGSGTSAIVMSAGISIAAALADRSTP